MVNQWHQCSVGCVEKGQQLHGVIQELADEAFKHELGISNNRADGFSGVFMSNVLPYMASKCSENVLT